jgi:hypothetical protein
MRQQIARSFQASHCSRLPLYCHWYIMLGEVVGVSSLLRLVNEKSSRNLQVLVTAA